MNDTGLNHWSEIDRPLQRPSEYMEPTNAKWRGLFRRERVLLTLALMSSIIPLALLSLLIVPAPSRTLWLVAVGIGEWSLIFGCWGLAGAILGILQLRGGAIPGGGLACVCGLLAAALSLYPLIASLPVARANGVRLSISKYFLGTRPKLSIPVQTFTFAMVEGTPLHLDAYLPFGDDKASESETRRAAIVVVHGGGWDSGRRSDFSEWDRWLVSEGYAVFDIDYRVSPQPNWCTSVEDALTAIIWVKDHAVLFGIDRNRIALLGRSAGGQLALVAAYKAANAVKEIGKPDATVRAVVAFYAPTDLVWSYYNPANQRVIDGPDTLRRLTGGSPDTVPENYNWASPTMQVSGNSPPTMLVHGGQDQLVRHENMTRLMQELRTNKLTGEPLGRDTGKDRAVYLPYAQHGFDYNFRGWGSQIVEPLLLDFLATNVR
jgi:acetyl esterase/lipase